MKKPTYTDLLAQLGIGSAHPGGLALTKSIFNKEKKITNEMRLLDIGCGSGETAAYLSKTFSCNIAALDSHKVMLEKAKKRFSIESLPISLVEGNSEALPFKNQTFDIVIAESVISFTNVQRTLQEVQRVLKAGGFLLAIEMTSEQKLSREEILNIKCLYNINEILSETEWIEAFTSVNFSRVDVFCSKDFSIDYDYSESINLPSENINPTIYKLLEQHSHLLQSYRDKLSYRIYRCEK